MNLIQQFGTKYAETLDWAGQAIMNAEEGRKKIAFCFKAVVTLTAAANLWLGDTNVLTAGGLVVFSQGIASFIENPSQTLEKVDEFMDTAGAVLELGVHFF